MSLLFYPRKSHRHPALREPTLAHVVYGASAILDCKDSDYFSNRKIKRKNLLKGPQIAQMKRINKGSGVALKILKNPNQNLSK